MADVLLRRRHTLLMDLLRVSLRQTEALRDSRLDDFLQGMAVRSGIFQELAATELEPPDNLIGFPSREQAQSDAEIRALIPSLVTAIMDQDDENERLLRARMEELHAALAQLGQGYYAARGYAAVAAAGERPSLLDLAF